MNIGPADPEILRRTSLVRHKIGYHGNVPRGIGKTGHYQENPRKYLPFGEKIVKIGPVDTEIALLRVKKRNRKCVAEPT